MVMREIPPSDLPTLAVVFAPFPIGVPTGRGPTVANSTPVVATVQVDDLRRSRIEIESSYSRDHELSF